MFSFNQAYIVLIPDSKLTKSNEVIKHKTHKLKVGRIARYFTRQMGTCKSKSKARFNKDRNEAVA